MRDGFVFERGYYEALECLPPEEQHEVTIAIFKFAFSGEEYKSDKPALNGMFKLIKSQIEKGDFTGKNNVLGVENTNLDNKNTENRQRKYRKTSKNRGKDDENNNLKNENLQKIVPNHEIKDLGTDLNSLSQLNGDFGTDFGQQEGYETRGVIKESSKENYIPLDSNLDSNLYRESSLHSDSMSKSGDFDPPISQNDQINFSLLTSYWNYTIEKAKSIIPKIRKIDEERKKSVLARVREYSKEDLMEMIQKVSVNDFLNGKNDRGWVATFDWCIKPRNFKKIIEDNYNNKNIQNGNNQTGWINDRRRGVPAGNRNPDDFDSDF